MDGGEEEFVSDDGGGTPVQDEHPQSDGEEMRSDGRHSEDEVSNDEDAPIAMETGGAASSSDAEDRRGVDSDSDGEAPGGHGEKSDSEAEAPRAADSDDDSPVKRRMSGSENEEEEEDELPEKRRTSGSDNEEASPVKRGVSDNEEEEEEEEEEVSPVKRRGSSSEPEDGPKGADGSESENEEEKRAPSPDRRSDSDSDTETAARRKAAPMDSEEEEEEERPAEEEGAGKWKGVMQSDSEEEEEEGRRKKAAAGSDEEQQEEQHRDDSDEDDEKPVKRKKAVLSDSEDEEEEKEEQPAPKRSRAVSDDANWASDGSGGLDKSLAAKLRELGSDSGTDEEDRSKPAAGNKDEKALFGSDSESGEEDEEEKIIADIFGESGDEEEEEFTGFNQEELEADKQPKEPQRVAEESDSDEGVERGGQDTSLLSDFDIMLAKRKAMNSRKRRHRDGGTFISDADDVVSAMITKMNEAAEEDRTLNSQKKPALKKLTLLPQVVMHLKKQDLKETFIDSGVMSAIKEWISPLPDKSLPALRIREELLRILQELPNVSQETLKHSGIGRAVMFLYKHPKESRPNKDLALKLINEWSRPIFGLTSNYKGMTREERQQRDLDQQTPQRRRLSEPQKVERAEEPDVFSPPTSSGGQTPRRDLEKQLTGEEKALRPGDPGFCARARVPMPSNKDYVVRPKWNVEGDSSRGPMKKGMSRVDKQMRRFADIRRLTKTGHAVKISVEGNRMPL
ncbi:protein IWS1 homolog isoform X1 [Fundulus heteroclitus]|uniref:protein IWS1 homolog isoform X1 n=1 Tax=Fundulus heteroclitus TaxID=8078 RepID=UPI00165C717A|nr:protein IWS1 homolog isoform X1 [Fundulus heteroclitus]